MEHIDLTNRCQAVASVIYLSNGTDAKVDAYLKRHSGVYFEKLLSELEIPLYYLTTSMRNQAVRDRFAYLHPAMSYDDDLVETVVNAYRDILVLENGLSDDANGFVLMDGESERAILDYYPVDGNGDFEPQFRAYVAYLKERLRVRAVPNGRMQTSKAVRGEITSMGDALDVKVYVEPMLDYSLSLEYNADDKFESESQRLLKEVRERADLLHARGHLRMLFDLMLEYQGLKPGLSRLGITADYRLFLLDWGNREVVMNPLSKTVYLFFLRHEGGVCFKDLADYKGELLSIYKQLASREDLESMRESIEALTDVFNNSINEKCSRIRSAFVHVVDKSLVNEYVVCGKRGEPKRIVLDRSLVVKDYVPQHEDC